MPITLNTPPTPSVIDPTGPIAPSDEADRRILTNERMFVGQRRGLVSPNTGAARLLPLPKVMASPPTVTPGTSGGASAISSSILWSSLGVGTSPNDSLFNFYGPPPMVGPTFPNNGYISPLWTQGYGIIDRANGWAVEFDFYGDKFELEIKGNGLRYQLEIDREVDDWQGRIDAPADGGRYRILYDFGSAGFRRVRFNFDGGISFGGIRTGPNHTVWKPMSDRGPRVIITGDSFTESWRSWTRTLAYMMGWKDVWTVGKGSTGYVDTNTGADTYRDRAPKDIYPWNPDIVIVSGGINDTSTSPALVNAEAQTFFREIRANCPNAALIVSGCQWSFGSPISTTIQTRDAIRSAATPENGVALYIEQLGGPYPYSGVIANYVDTGWMTGTGRVGATTGVGNSDIFRSSDTTHPTQEGHDYRGYRHAAAITAAMPVLGTY